MAKWTAESIIERFGLTPYPEEGGWFRETYRCGEEASADGLPERYGARRSFGTCIYYLLTGDTLSRLHRLKSDEIFHFYLGDPVRMLHLYPDGSSDVLTLGHDVVNGEHVQVVVPRGTWQGAVLVEGGEFALMGCTVAPGFDFADYETGDRAELLARWPDRAELIEQLTDQG